MYSTDCNALSAICTRFRSVSLLTMPMNTAAGSFAPVAISGRAPTIAHGLRAWRENQSNQGSKSAAPLSVRPPSSSVRPRSSNAPRVCVPTSGVFSDGSRAAPSGASRPPTCLRNSPLLNPTPRCGFVRFVWLRKEHDLQQATGCPLSLSSKAMMSQLRGLP